MSDFDLMRLGEERFRNLDEAKAIFDKADGEGRELSDSERRQIDVFTRKAREIGMRMELVPNTTEAKQTIRRVADPIAIGAPFNDGMHTALDGGHTLRGVTAYRDKSGKLVHVVSRDGSMVDVVRSQHPDMPGNLNLGKVVKAMIVHRWDDDAEYERRAMSEGINSAGGFLVPDEIGAGVIDLARAQSVLFQAGVSIVPMTSDRLTLARLTSDPTYQVKAENVAFAESDATFDALGFTARTIGTLVAISRELAEDAPNASAVLQQSVARGLALKLDQYGLTGSGAAEPLGIANTPGVQADAAVGAMDWDHVLADMALVEGVNGVPRSFVTTPEFYYDLQGIMEGDGTNSPLAYQHMPQACEALQILRTTSCASGESYLGDFTQGIVALRGGPMIAISDVAGDSFAKHQVWIKIVWRGDFGVAHPTHIVKLSGIT